MGSGYSGPIVRGPTSLPSTVAGVSRVLEALLSARVRRRLCRYWRTPCQVTGLCALMKQNWPSRRSAVVLFCCIGLLGACKPSADDLDVRAIEYIKIMIMSPDNAKRLGEIAKCDDVSADVDGQSAKIALQYLWALHQQGVELRYLLAEKRLLPGHSQVLTVVVYQGDRKVLGGNVSSYFFDVYFAQSSTGQWCIVRAQIRS